MKKPRWHLFRAWIACFAVLLASLAPSISYAVAQQRAAPFTEDICSAAGVPAHHLAADPDAGHHDAPGASHMEHCPFCSKHGGMVGLPPSHGGIVAIVLPAFRPALFYQSSRPLFAWAPAQARAPPVIA